MKKNKPRITGEFIKYVAPSILFLSSSASFSAMCRQYSCALTPAGHEDGGLFTLAGGGTTSWSGGCSNPVANTTRHFFPYGTNIIVPLSSHCTFDPFVRFTSGCRVNCKKNAGAMPPESVVAGQRDNAPSKMLGARYNSLLRLLHQRKTMMDATKMGAPDSLASSSPSLLGEITIKLILTELNKVERGVHINLGERLDTEQLSKEQLAVLIDHKGLLEEAIRQLRKAHSGTQLSKK